MIERVSLFVDSLNISVRAFEQKICASNGLIRKAITNKTDIQSKWLIAIAENYPQLNIRWLLTGEGSMLRATEETEAVSTIIYKENPDKNEIIGLQRSKIELLEEKIDELKKELTELRSAVQSDTSYADVATSSAVFRAHKRHD